MADYINLEKDEGFVYIKKQNIVIVRPIQGFKVEVVLKSGDVKAGFQDQNYLAWVKLAYTKNNKAFVSFDSINRKTLHN